MEIDRREALKMGLAPVVAALLPIREMGVEPAAVGAQSGLERVCEARAKLIRLRGDVLAMPAVTKAESVREDLKALLDDPTVRLSVKRALVAALAPVSSSVLLPDWERCDYCDHVTPLESADEIDAIAATVGPEEAREAVAAFTDRRNCTFSEFASRRGVPEERLGAVLTKSGICRRCTGKQRPLSKEYISVVVRLPCEQMSWSSGDHGVIELLQASFSQDFLRMLVLHLFGKNGGGCGGGIDGCIELFAEARQHGSGTRRVVPRAERLSGLSI